MSVISELSAKLAEYRQGPPPVGSSGPSRDHAIKHLEAAISSSPIEGDRDALIVAALLVEAVLRDLSDNELQSDCRRRLLTRLIPYLEQRFGCDLASLGLAHYVARLQPYASTLEVSHEVAH